jgi:hypothetical protein
LQPDELVDAWAPRMRDLTDDLVDDTNHYTILMGERGASAVADALTRSP